MIAWTVLKSFGGESGSRYFAKKRSKRSTYSFKDRSELNQRCNLRNVKCFVTVVFFMLHRPRVLLRRDEVWIGRGKSNYGALVGSWNDQSGLGLWIHIFALIAWTGLTCFWEEGGSRDFGKIPKSSKNGLNLYPKAFKIHARRRQTWGPEGSWAGLRASCAILGQQGRFWKRFGPSGKRLWGVLGCLGRKKVANMAPSWPPKRNPNRK